MAEEAPKRVHVVMRILRFARGPATAFPIQAYLNEGDAKAQAARLDEAFTDTMAMELCAVRGKQVKRAGMTAQDFLASLGLEEFDHRVISMTLPEPELIEPANAGEVTTEGGIIVT